MGSLTMDFNPYIFGSYAAAALLLGGLILHTLLTAHRTTRALRGKTRHEA